MSFKIVQLPPERRVLSQVQNKKGADQKNPRRRPPDDSLKEDKEFFTSLKSRVIDRLESIEVTDIKDRIHHNSEVNKKKNESVQDNHKTCVKEQVQRLQNENKTLKRLNRTLKRDAQTLETEKNELQQQVNLLTEENQRLSVMESDIHALIADHKQCCILM